MDWLKIVKQIIPISFLLFVGFFMLYKNKKQRKDLVKKLKVNSKVQLNNGLIAKIKAIDKNKLLLISGNLEIVVNVDQVAILV